jgi:hypothetical protein
LSEEIPLAISIEDFKVFFSKGRRKAQLPLLLVDI